MATGDPSEDMVAFPGSGPDPGPVGARLRAAREAAGLDLGEIATRTRIPQRHLEAIERSAYGDLPAPTYAVGFARSYARAIDADEVAVARDVRAELGREPVRRPEGQSYQPVDPARVPPRLLAWTAAALAALFLIGFLVWRSWWFSDTPSSSPDPRAARPAVATAPVARPAAGQVVLTATSRVWVQITTASGEKLVNHEMKEGETFAVPPTADRPTIVTGRPNALRVTVDGREVAALGPPERRIKDVGISAAALAARPVVSQTATDSGGPRPE